MCDIASRVPMPGLCIEAVFLCCLEFGLDRSRRVLLYIVGAVLLWLGYEGLLRPWFAPARYEPGM